MNRIYLLGLSALFLFSCTQTPKVETETNQVNTSQNDLLSAEVVVKDYVNIVTNDNPDWVKSAVDSKVVETILNIAIDGSVIVYSVDEDTIPFTVNEIKDNLGASSDSMQIEVSKGVFIDTLITSPADLQQVEGLFFKENWIFNADNFKFTKQINEYLPVREYYKQLSDGTIDTTKKVKRLVFKVINDKNSKNLEKIATDVTTAFYFNADLPSFINGLDVTRFVNYLINYSYKDKKDVYDFYEQNNKLLYDDVKDALGASTDTLEIETTPGNMKEVVIDYDPDVSEIIGVVFVENWYLDKQTLSFKKEVIGLAPIRQIETFDPNGESYTKTTIPYLIKL